MSFKSIATLLITLIFISTSFAQNTSRFFANSTIGVQGHYGSFITAVPKADYLKDSYTSFGEINLSKPICGTYKASTKWGVSLFYGNTGSKQYIGKMAGVFPYLNFRLFGGNVFKSSFRTGLGGGWIEKPYDVKNNHKNVLLGSHLNIFIDLMWKNELKLSDHLNLNAGLSFSHLSNASIKLPNLGVNTPALSAGVSYAFNQSTPHPFTTKDSTYKNISYRIRLSVGMKQTPWIESYRYETITGEIEVAKNHKGNFNYGAGIAVFYDPSLPHMYLDPVITIGPPYKHTINVGPYIMYEKLVGRLSIPLQLGIYAIDDYLGLLFQNIGFRYRLSNHWSAGGYLKTHWGKADFIHAGIDYIF